MQLSPAWPGLRWAVSRGRHFERVAQLDGAGRDQRFLDRGIAVAGWPKRRLLSESVGALAEAFGERADALAGGRDGRFGQAGDGDAPVEEALVAAGAVELRDPLEVRPQDGDRGDDEHQLDQRRNADGPAQARPGGRSRQGPGEHRRQRWRDDDAAAPPQSAGATRDGVPSRIVAPTANGGGCS